MLPNLIITCNYNLICERILTQLIRSLEIEFSAYKIKKDDQKAKLNSTISLYPSL